jgi:hypothetical protein
LSGRHKRFAGGEFQRRERTKSVPAAQPLVEHVSVLAGTDIAKAAGPVLGGEG